MPVIDTQRLLGDHRVLDALDTDEEVAAVAIYDHLAPLFDKGLSTKQIKKRYSIPGLNDEVTFDSIEEPGERRVIKFGKSEANETLIDAARAVHHALVSRSAAQESVVTGMSDLQMLADLAAEQGIRDPEDDDDYEYDYAPRHNL